MDQLDLELIAQHAWSKAAVELGLTPASLPVLTVQDDLLIVLTPPDVDATLVLRHDLASGTIVAELQALDGTTMPIRTTVDLGAYCLRRLGLPVTAVLGRMHPNPPMVVGAAQVRTRFAVASDADRSVWTVGLCLDDTGTLTPVLLGPADAAVPRSLVLEVSPHDARATHLRTEGGTELALAEQATAVLSAWALNYRARSLASAMAFGKPSGPHVPIELATVSPLGGVGSDTAARWRDVLLITTDFARLREVPDTLRRWRKAASKGERTATPTARIADTAGELLEHAMDMRNGIQLAAVFGGGRQVLLPAHGADALMAAPPLPVEARARLQPREPFTVTWLEEPLNVDLNTSDHHALDAQGLVTTPTAEVLGVVHVADNGATNMLWWIVRTGDVIGVLLGHAELAELGDLAWGALALATWHELEPPPTVPPLPPDAKKRDRKAHVDQLVTSGALLQVRRLRESMWWSSPNALSWQQYGDRFILAPPA